VNGWVDWPTSAVPPPPPPANSLIADPFLFYDARRAAWGMLVATCLGGSNYANCELPRVQLYESQALPPSTWALASDFFVGPESTGIRPECPRLWRFSAPLGGCPDGSEEDVTLLVYSSTLQAKSLWFLGRVNSSLVFEPHATGFVDAGSFYAAHAFGGAGGWGASDLNVVGWLQELRPQTPVNVTPWFNLMSLPRTTALASDCARISSQPAQWTRALRSPVPVWAGNVTVVAANGLYALPAAVAATGASLWLDATLAGWGPCTSSTAWTGIASSRSSSLSSNATWSVFVLATNSSAGPRSTGENATGPLQLPIERTAISVTAGAVSVNLTAASLDESTGRGVYTASAAPGSVGFSGLSVLVDQNAVEVFAHSDVPGEAVISAFAYPTLAASTGVILAADADACISVSVYAMPDSRRTRPTTVPAE
jgi:sucrose-6-phosphate hydrolase SacC (GH32 family)